MVRHVERGVWAVAFVVLTALLVEFNYPLPPLGSTFLQIVCYGLILIYALHVVWLIAEEGRRFLQSRELLIKLVVLGAVGITFSRPTLAAGIIIIEESLRVFGRLMHGASMVRFFERIRSQPALLISGTFAIAIALGSILLSLPVATVGKQIRFLDALFTATSAVCVTGLTVQETATYFTSFGQGVILALIQIGGLGIMTMSISLALVLGKRLGVRERVAMQDAIEEPDITLFRQVFRNLLQMTFALETIGAVILSARWFVEFQDLPKAVYYGIFHAISAFCNAGFSLFSDSLIRYQTDPTINLTISLLVLFGGLGFTVMYGLLLFYRSSHPRILNLHVKMTLAVTGIMLLGGMLFILLTEYSSSLLHLPWYDKLWVAWFQSVTLRTAGFHTIDFSTLSGATVMLSCIWMFIGASPGSTGGGIKTTTVGVLYFSVRSMLQGRENVEAFGRTIPWGTVRKSIAITFLAVGLVVSGIIVLLLAEPFSFQEAVFEALSAAGTVGLSLGATAKLTAIGKTVIITLMYVGRIGPLTVAFLMGTREAPLRYRLPEDKVIVG